MKSITKPVRHQASVKAEGWVDEQVGSLLDGFQVASVRYARSGQI